MSKMKSVKLTWAALAAMAAVGAAGATVVWKQLRGVDWPVESVEQLQQHVENPDSGSYEDFIAVY